MGQITNEVIGVLNTAAAAGYLGKNLTNDLEQAYKNQQVEGEQVVKQQEQAMNAAEERIKHMNAEDPQIQDIEKFKAENEAKYSEAGRLRERAKFNKMNLLQQQRYLRENDPYADINEIDAWNKYAKYLEEQKQQNIQSILDEQDAEDWNAQKEAMIKANQAVIAEQNAKLQAKRQAKIQKGWLKDKKKNVGGKK